MWSWSQTAARNTAITRHASLQGRGQAFGKEPAMSNGTQAIALVAIIVCIVGMAWSLLWPTGRRSGADPVSPHWDLIYVDEDGALLFTMVRVLRTDFEARRLTAWCSRTGAERVFKFSKILKATDVHSGVRINLAKWMAQAGVAPTRQPVPHQVDDLTGELPHLWRSLDLRAH
jgi:hypothetical protein